MQFHPTGTDPTAEGLLVCRNARFNLLVLLAVFWAIPFAWWWFEVRWIAYGCVVLALLLTGPMLGSWRKRGRAENWVLALLPSELWVNLRDCEYYGAEPGLTVVSIPYDEVRAAYKSVHRYKTPDSDGDVSHRDVYLDLQISSPQREQLRDALQQERQLPGPRRKYLGGLVTVGAKNLKQQPVDFVGDDLLRIKFTVGNYGLRPPVKHVLAELRRYTTVREEVEQSTKDWEKLSDSEFNTFLRKLVLDGRDIRAIDLLRRRTGKSTVEAREFVDEIRRQVQ